MTRHEKVDEFAGWLASIGSAPKTVRVRVSGVEGLARYAGLDDPATVTTRQIADWLARPDLSTSTRVTYWHTARAWGAFLAARRHRRTDPAAAIPRPTTDRRTVDDSVVEQLLTQPSSARAHAYTVLTVFGGLPAGAIARLRGEDLQPGRRCWLHPRMARLAAWLPAAGYCFPGALNGHVRPVSVSRTLATSLRRAGSSAPAAALLDPGVRARAVRRSAGLDPARGPPLGPGPPHPAKQSAGRPRTRRYRHRPGPRPDTGGPTVNASSPNENDPGDVRRVLPGLRDQLDRLSGALTIWAGRDDDQVQPDVTGAGWDAYNAIDILLAELHGLRSQLVDQIGRRRAAQDALWDAKHPTWRDTGSGPGAQS